jgi:hypothetical protein
MSVISDLQSKIKAFKLIVEANSITPTVVGSLLNEIVSELDSISSSLTDLSTTVGKKADSNILSELAILVDGKASKVALDDISEQLNDKLDAPIVIESEDEYDALSEAGKLDNNKYYVVLE